MIKASELRIGNWLKRNSQPDGFQIDSRSFFTMEEHPDWYEPIVLTPEILRKCGFKKETDERLETVMIGEGGREHKQMFKHTRWYHSNTWINLKSLADYEIKFVHTLQNCWFFKTGKELEITL